jgi:hypothetical protein
MRNGERKRRARKRGQSRCSSSIDSATSIPGICRRMQIATACRIPTAGRCQQWPHFNSAAQRNVRCVRWPKCARSANNGDCKHSVKTEITRVPQSSVSLTGEPRKINHASANSMRKMYDVIALHSCIVPDSLPCRFTRKFDDYRFPEAT